MKILFFLLSHNFQANVPKNNLRWVHIHRGLRFHHNNSEPTIVSSRAVLAKYDPDPQDDFGTARMRQYLSCLAGSVQSLLTTYFSQLAWEIPALFEVSTIAKPSSNVCVVHSKRSHEWINLLATFISQKRALAVPILEAMHLNTQDMTTPASQIARLKFFFGMNSEQCMHLPKLSP